VLAATLVLGVGTLALACSSDDEAPPQAPDWGKSREIGATLDPGAPPCVDGTIESCSITLGEHDGILSCYEGKRACAGGRFGECQDGRYFELEHAAVESGSGASLLSISDPALCATNPCNRYCREYLETPTGGLLLPDADPSTPALEQWNTGTLASYPPAVRALGSNEPCQGSADCQFDQACTDPARGTCSHTVCNPGEALADGCSSCSDAVCALDPSCCGITTACEHDPCVSGAALVPACDQCVATICGAHPECCGTTWDAACVGYVAAECGSLGQSCACPDGALDVDGQCYQLNAEPLALDAAQSACVALGAGWDLVQVDDFNENAVAAGVLQLGSVTSAWIGARESVQNEWRWLRDDAVFFLNDAGGGSLQNGYVYANWTEGTPELDASERGALIALNGRWSDADPSAANAAVCEGPALTLTPKKPTAEWKQACIDRVGEACGAQCPSGASVGLGACVSRAASELDASCASFDLAVGATCALGPTPQLPVCNHGQAASPAGIKILHVAAGQIGSATPDFASAVECTLSEPVPPGRCVVVSDCSGLSAGREIIVNPDDGSATPGECHGDDNWSIYQGGACGAPLCEASLHAPAQLATDQCAVLIDNAATIDPTSAEVVLHNAVSSPSCGAGELRWGGSCYFVSSEIATWDQARDSCQQRGPGWDLIALNGAFENFMARGLVTTHEEVQIGFNDQGAEGDHRWSNGSCVGWVNWANNQPNDPAPGGEQQCARMTSSSSIYAWEDKNCVLDEARYICEGPLDDPEGHCGSGQLEGPNGDCYELVPGSMSWPGAQAACQALGAGWSLAEIEDIDTNNFLAAHGDCTRAWIAKPTTGFARWEFGEPDNLSSDCPSLGGSFDLWRDESCTTQYAALCQGPRSKTDATVLTPVSDATACTSDDQYYFAAGLAPGSLTLCPAACSRAEGDGAPLSVDIGCNDAPIRAIETEHPEIYIADCDLDLTNPSDAEDPATLGSEGQWDFLRYDAVTPGDSEVRFAVRSAPTSDELDDYSFIEVASAHAVPTDTQRCELSPPECPISLFDDLAELEPPAYRQRVLELRITLVPGSNGEAPMLRDWRVQYSCPPSD
jgi:hypothetical protein